MKRFLSLMLVALSLLLCLAGCAKEVDPTAKAQANRDKLAESFADAKPFSFNELMQYYGENDDRRVQRSGFQNTDKQEVTTPEEAIERAKAELATPDSFDDISVSYDSEMCVICVNFAEKNTVGGDISVYLHTGGRTYLIVAGE